MPKDKSKSPLMEQLKPLFFKVRKVDIGDILEETSASGLSFNPSITHWIIAQDNKGNDVVVNACSKGYHLISNEELMEPLVRKLEKEFFNVKANTTVFGLSKFYTDFIFMDEIMGVITGDKIFPRMRMNNSYDGSVKYSFDFGFWREICTNGLRAPIQGLKNVDIKIRHTAGVGARAIQDTMDSIAIYIENAPKILKGYKGLTKNTLKWEQALSLIEEVTENTKFSSKKGEEVLAQLEKEKNLGLPVNPFLVYNAFNHVLYASDMKMKLHKRDKLDQQVLEYITNEYE